MNDWDNSPATDQQKEQLTKWLPNGTDCSNLTADEARRLWKLHNPNAAWRSLRQTEHQERFLRDHGLWREGYTRGQAADVISKAVERNRLRPGFLTALNVRVITEHMLPYDGNLSLLESSPEGEKIVNKLRD